MAKTNKNLANFEVTVRRYYDREANLRLFLTGSSSRLLSSEIATALRGRTLSHYVPDIR